MRKPTRIPKPTLLDNMQHVQLGMAKADTGGGEIQTIRIKNHRSLRSLELGEASPLDIEMLTVAINTAKGLAKQGLQTEWSKEIVAGQQALDTVKATGDVTPNSLQAVQLALMIHDRQLDVATVTQLERSLTKRNTNGKA